MMDDIHEIARIMYRHYGESGAALMDVRSSACRRSGELASAALWHLVAQEVRMIVGTAEAFRIRREAARR
jgi:hypothetical protein